MVKNVDIELYFPERLRNIYKGSPENRHIDLKD